MFRLSPESLIIVLYCTHLETVFKLSRPRYSQNGSCNWGLSPKPKDERVSLMQQESRKGPLQTVKRTLRRALSREA